MRRRLAIAGCLIFSGLAALVYQILWTRLLGFAFGTTTEAIATVLAIFFGGMALGNWLAARSLFRVRRPLRLYALLELGIGGFALASLPLLHRLDALQALLGPDVGALPLALLRIGSAAVILLPPTVAMGATLPVVARALVTRDASLGRWSAFLYGANTLGAVLGAYLCGFWLIPELGLTRSLWIAAAANTLAAGVVGIAARGRDGVPPEPPAQAVRPPAAGRRIFLVFFGVSGFVAIGYEIVWSRVFGIVMEGTLYGFSTVLTSFLLGIALGSLAMAPWVDRLRDPARAFGLLHVAIAASVALGLMAVPLLPHAHAVLVERIPGDPLHLLFLLAAPVVWVPTALFGAAFPVLIRIYTGHAAEVGVGMGRAVAVNTAGSILASLAVGFWALPALGMDATLFALLLIDLGVALLVLLRFQPTPGPRRLAPAGLAMAVLLLLSLSYNGVQVEKAIAGREAHAADLESYLQVLEQRTGQLQLVIEGRSAIVTVADTPFSRQLGSNGLAESGLRFDPPYYPLETVLLGALPYLLADSPERALVVGLGGGNTVTALRRTGLSQIDVVELEAGMVRAVEALYRGRESPLSDPRVRLRINDGRNELLRGRQQGGVRYDVIASQPSHPWLQGAANLFTEEYFTLARQNLAEGGVFALWLNGFRTDAESVLAVATSFERVFPGGLLVNGVRHPNRGSLLLLGGLHPLHIDPEALTRRLAQPPLAELLALFDLRSVEDLLAQLEGPLAAFAAIEPDASNTDDNAFVETRIPRRFGWAELDFGRIEASLPADAPVLPSLSRPVDLERVVRALLAVRDPSGAARHVPKALRLLAAHGQELPAATFATLRAEARLQQPPSAPAAVAELEELGRAHPNDPAALRALGHHLAGRERRFEEAARMFAEAFSRSGVAEDAYHAGRSLHPVSPRAAQTWLARIPERERKRFPRLAFYDAERALAAGRPREELTEHRLALERFRDTQAGRSFPGTTRLLARLCEALGDPTAATAYADSAHRERSARATPWIERARADLARPDLSSAAAALERVEELLPGDPRLLHLRAELAGRSGNPARFEQALRELRSVAPTLNQAVATENRLRGAQGLPLLPDRSAETLLAQDY